VACRGIGILPIGQPQVYADLTDGGRLIQFLSVSSVLLWAKIVAACEDFFHAAIFNPIHNGRIDPPNTLSDAKIED